jgi:glycosyltransferase involved in cell wall biosynthesis
MNGENILTNPYAESYSFVIITDGREPEKLERLLQSIEKQNFPEVEVVIVRDENHEGRLGALRNAGCKKAQYYTLIVMDDDMILHNDFYPGLLKYGHTDAALSCRIVNPDNTRYWDWKAHKDGKNWLLDYGETHPLVSLTGGFCVITQGIFSRVQWDEHRGFNQEEDVDFSNRLKAAGVKIEFNPWSTVTHDAPYTQYGIGVIKK